ncbi:MAG: MFS family permease [Verrucomicrobiales bacterium]|jgi:MFS family permease
MASTLFASDQRGLTFATMSTIAVAGYNNLSVSAALPAIGEDLGNLELLPWIITIELIASAVAVLAIGPVIDSFGTRIVFRASLVAFGVASLACAFAPTLATLIVARAFQGLTTGAIIANVMTAIGLGVPEALRARAYAANSSVWGIMGVGGPAVAALILTIADWSAIFLVNLPVALIAGIVGWNAFPEAEAEATTHPSDRRGLVIVVFFTLLSLGALSSLSWWSPIAFAVSLVFIGLYAVHEKMVEAPVVRVRHVTAPTIRLLHIAAFLTVTSAICASTFLPVYVKGARGASTAEAAFTVVFLTVGWTSGAFISSRISELRRGEFAMLIGAGMLAVSVTITALAVWFTWPLWAIFAALTGVGMGVGGLSSATLGVLQSKAIPAEMGRVNSAHQFMRTLGFTYGAALGGAVLFSVVKWRLGDAEVVRDLLGDDAVTVEAGTIDALARGFAWSAVVAVIFGYGAFMSVWRLNRAQ